MGLTEALLHPYFPHGPGWEGLGCGQQGQAQWRGHRAYNSSCCSELLSLPPGDYTRPRPRGCGSHSDGVLLGHMLSTLSSSLTSSGDGSAHRVSVSSLPGTRPAWLHSCPKCPVLAPGRRVFHHRDSLTQQS